MAKLTMSIGEAAAALGCSEKTIRRMIDDRKIKAIQYGGRGGTWHVYRGEDGLPVARADAGDGGSE